MDLLTWIKKRELRWEIKNNLAKREGTFLEIVFDDGEKSIDSVKNDEYFKNIIENQIFPILIRLKKLHIFLNNGDSENVFEFIEWLKNDKKKSFDIIDGNDIKYVD